jgi:membrane-associated HD superfamily phosphohydrolase
MKKRTARKLQKAINHTNKQSLRLRQLEKAGLHVHELRQLSSFIKNALIGIAEQNGRVVDPNGVTK